MTTPAFETEVVASVIEGNRDAFRQLVEAYSLPLRSYLSSKIYRMDDVDDLAQEVFIIAYKKLATWRRGESFGAWLRGIAHNEVLAYYRARTRRQSTLCRFREEVSELVHNELDRLAAADKTEAIEQLLLCIAQLPDRLRKVVRAGLNGETTSKLATEMQTSAGAIYALHYRANQLLRTCMERRIF